MAISAKFSGNKILIGFRGELGERQVQRFLDSPLKARGCH